MQLAFIIGQVQEYRSILKLNIKPLAFTSYNLKKKRDLETSLPVSFSVRFLNKNITIVMFFYQTNFHYVVAFSS